MSELYAWIESHQEWLTLLAASSLGLMLVTALAIPITVCRLPENYFVTELRHSARLGPSQRRIWGAIVLAKNVLGAVLVLAGLAMLVLPGQGLLTIVLGLALMNFPGKYRLERRLVKLPAVHRALNSIRSVSGCPPLIIPPGDELAA